MNTRRLSPELVYYWQCLAFPSETLALRYFSEVNSKLGGKGLDLGVYRHQPSDDLPRFVTLVSINQDGVQRAERLPLAGAAVPHPLEIELVDALMLRRANVIEDLHETHFQGTQVRIRHGRGAQLTPDGDLLEQIGGDE